MSPEQHARAWLEHYGGLGWEDSDDLETLAAAFAYAMEEAREGLLREQNIAQRPPAAR